VDEPPFFLFFLTPGDFKAGKIWRGTGAPDRAACRFRDKRRMYRSRMNWGGAQMQPSRRFEETSGAPHVGCGSSQTVELGEGKKRDFGPGSTITGF